MCRLPLDLNAVRPRAMARYLYNNGWHFDKKTCKYAVSLMRKKNSVNGQLEAIQPMEKEQVDELLKRYNVKLQNDVGHDAVYVANFGKNTLTKSVQDEQHLALYVKEVVDDPNAADGTIMREWYARMIAAGLVVDWLDLLDDE